MLRVASIGRNRVADHLMGKVPVKPVAQGAKTVGAFAARVTAKAFEDHGLSHAVLLGDWPAIAGVELAQFTRPERLIWPRRGEAKRSSSEARQASPGATLVLRVEGPRAIEIQHIAPQLIERLNTYLGYGAIARIRIEQAPLGTPSNENPKPGGFEEAGTAYPTDDLDEIDDEGLRAALARLGRQTR
jgi:hypothetical protein